MNDALAALAKNRIWLMAPHILARYFAVAQKLAVASRTEARTGEVRPKATGKIAVLPMHGMIEQRGSIFLEMFGGTSTESFGAVFDQLAGDPSIKGIVVDIDSPGGTVSGVPELAEKIFAARGTKPIVGVANSMAASAAYWLGSSFDRLFVTPSGEVGSIGVYSIHQDFSKALEEAGVSTTVFQVPAYKAEFSPFTPLTDAAKAHEQAEIERIYDQFVGDVARNRGATPASVRKQFGEGRMVDAKAAVERGMADRVATLEQVIRRVASGHIRVDQPAAADTWGDGPSLRESSEDVRARWRLRQKGILRK